MRLCSIVPLYEIDFCLESKAHNKFDCNYIYKKVKSL